MVTPPMPSTGTATARAIAASVSMPSSGASAGFDGVAHTVPAMR
jgi:hypothetical protein